MARSVAQDWERIERQLSATVGSIYNQTDPNFRIIIACTEKPTLSVATDERLEFRMCEHYTEGSSTSTRPSVNCRRRV